MSQENFKLLEDSLILRHEDKNKGFRTKVMAGYDLYKDNRGISQLGEVLFEEENQTVLGGTIFTLEKLFGVQSPLTVDYINNIMNIATAGPVVTDIYPKDNVVCLFGVGTGGAGDTIASVQDVKIYERQIFDMIPFRVTNQALSLADQDKYWFKQLRTVDAKTAYYLKKFEAPPLIKVLWKDGIGDADGTEVAAGVENSTSTIPIETFVELILKVTKDDCREWFIINGNVAQTRVNSIGLFTGIKSPLGDGTFDFKQVKLFSKLNINNEMLVEAKDMNIIYRIYTS